MHLGIVVPTYNRLKNLEILLYSIQQQSYQDFTVVIADDGSVDGTDSKIRGMQKTLYWQDRLVYISGGINKGGRTGRSRNLGAANLPPNANYLVMLDSDLILHPDNFASIVNLLF